jgi:hypothetical protein
MSASVTPADTPPVNSASVEENQVEESKTADTTIPSAASLKSTDTKNANSPTKYAIEVTEEGTPAPIEQPVEAMEVVEEGIPVPPVESANVPSPKPSPKTTSRKTMRKKSRRLSFADEVGDGQLCEVSYHQNLHYAQKEEIPKSNKKKKNQEAGCCIIS